MKKVSIILAVFLIWFSVSSYAQWVVDDPQKPTIQKEADTIKKMTVAVYSHMKIANKAMFNFFWHNPYYTPAQLSNELMAEGWPPVILFEEKPIVDNAISTIDNGYVPDQPPESLCDGNTTTNCFTIQTNGEVDFL